MENTQWRSNTIELYIIFHEIEWILSDWDSHPNVELCQYAKIYATNIITLEYYSKLEIHSEDLFKSWFESQRKIHGFNQRPIAQSAQYLRVYSYLLGLSKLQECIMA